MIKRTILSFAALTLVLGATAGSVRGDGMIPFLAITGRPTEAEVRAKVADMQAQGIDSFLIYARSGIASKRGLAPANKVGVIDSDYRGEILVALHNHSAETQRIERGERIAQLVITPYLTVQFAEAKSLDQTVRGAGGFGSTGSK